MVKKNLPKKYKSLEAEAKWEKFWEEKGVYRYDPNATRENTYVIDTPPPTVSGSLHVGHVFSYTQTDIIARFQRMRGKNVFYPIGWDDNGLPTERRVQSLFGIQCNPNLPYEDLGELKPLPAKKQKSQKERKEVSRENFLEACKQQTAEDEKKYEALWRHLGLSYDWSQQYATIDDHCRKISQKSFLDLVEKGYVYSTESPVMWDTTFQTAVAQAEIEERTKGGHYHDIQFQTEDGETFTISTTRPELLPACVAVVAHPDDERYKNMFGKKAITPLFEAEVPILPAEHADPEKGTGILMVCTFGDSADVDFWKAEKLPLKQVIGRKGKMVSVNFGEAPFTSRNPEKANAHYEKLKGLYVKQAKRQVAEMLKEGGFLTQEPTPTEQISRFYEKGEQPIEYVSTRQWFVKILDYKDQLIEQGRKIQWHPEHMFKRYEQWVEGLNQDWCISRQRFFGVPFPVWYRLDGEGGPDYENPIFAKEADLPCDPLSQAPAGFDESDRGKPGGFMGDPDVMDTWATSSVSPQINGHWGVDDERYQKLYPADLRPQAHEIIRTWAFYTIAKSWMHEKTVPWEHIAISGWVVNPDRKKMSKSKGDTVTPEELIQTYSADALRYWAGKARLGQDTIYDENVFKIGQRLTTKLFNASKFVMMQLEREDESLSWNMTDITEPIDKVWVSKINRLIEDSTEQFEKYDYAVALSNIEAHFWEFCDFYLELVKSRAYNMKSEISGLSALASLEWTLQSFLKLFAPFLPYITEEVWSWSFREKLEVPSIHGSLWPEPQTNDAFIQSPAELLDLTREAINAIRGTKSNAQKSLKVAVTELKICATAENIKLLQSATSDIIRSNNVQCDIHWEELARAPENKKVLVEATLEEYGRE